MPELRHRNLAIAREVKIADGIRIVEVTHKAKKLIRLRAELVGGKLMDLMFSGDFFMVPENALPELESALKGANLERSCIARRVLDFYKASGIQTPGVDPEDFVDAVMRLADNGEKVD